MAKTISLCDTHRLPYPNAVITAYKIGADGEPTTTRLKFKHGRDGSLDYLEVKTNARGYLCDENGNIYSKGIFLGENGFVKATFLDGTSTTWQVVVDDDTEVNDGRLLGVIDPSAPDSPDNLEQKWSANSKEDYTLDYNHLTNRPRINEWMELEQFVIMEKMDDTVQVDKFAKTMTITADEGVGPKDWEFDGTWKFKPADPRDANPNTTWQIKLTADPSRVAQLVCVRNWTPWRLTLLSNDETPKVIAVLDAFDGVNVNNGKFVSLFGTAETRLPFRGAPDLERLGMLWQVTYDKDKAAEINENSKLAPLVINDNTPDIVRVVFVGTADHNDLNKLRLFVKSAVTKARRIRIFLQDLWTVKGRVVTNVNGAGSEINIAAIANFSIAEFYVTPSSTTDSEFLQLANCLDKAGNTFVPNGGLTEGVAPDVTRVEWVVPSSATTLTMKTLSFDSDTLTDKVIYFVINNQKSDTFTLKLQFGSGDLNIPIGVGVNSFIVHKSGIYFSLLSGNANGASDKNFGISYVGYNNYVWTYKLQRTNPSQDTIRVNIPYLMQLAGMNRSSFPHDNEHPSIVFEVDGALTLDVQTTVHLDIDAYSVYKDGSNFGNAAIFFKNVGVLGSNSVSITDLFDDDTRCFCVSKQKIAVPVRPTSSGVIVSPGTFEEP